MRKKLRDGAAVNPPDSDDSDEENVENFFSVGERSTISKHLDDYVNMVIFSRHQMTKSFEYYERVDFSPFTPPMAKQIVDAMYRSGQN